MKLFKRLFIILTLTVIAAGTATAAEPINTLEKKGFFRYKPSGLAIRGFDTVAYFTEGKPIKGTDQYQHEWMGAKWNFSSEKHLSLFAANPEKYAPQYGGYCAYGVATDSLVKIEGDQWTIVDDKLYLNYDANLQEMWLKDMQNYIGLADGKFDMLLAE